MKASLAKLAIALAAAALFAAAGARADSPPPTFTITSGTNTIVGNGDAHWSFSGTSIDISGFAEFPPFAHGCGPGGCVPGARFGVNTALAGDMDGSAVVDGVSYPRSPGVDYQGRVSITGPPVVIPGTAALDIVLTGPVAFNGSLTGCFTFRDCAFGSGGTRIFRAEFNAIGTAAVDFHLMTTAGGHQEYFFRRATWTLQEAVPEPSSFLLLASSLLSLIGFKRRWAC